MPLPDLFRQLREHYKTHPLTIDEVDCGNVITRDETRFLSEDPERWRKKFHRQSKQNTRGVFARHNVPYRALGYGVTHQGLDAEEIILKTLKMPPKKTAFNHANMEDNEKDPKFVKMPDLIALPKKYEETENLPTSIRGGMSAIELVLKECDQRRVAQKKGVWYEDAAKAAERQQAAAIRAPMRENVILMKGTNRSKLLPPAEGNFKVRAIKHLRGYQRISKLPSLVGNNKAEISVADSIKHLVGDEDPLHVQFRPDGSVIPLEEIIRNNKMKARNDQIAKLNCIYRVMCCLHNLKLRDLKSQHLLEPATLKAISEKPLKKEPPFRPLTRTISLAPVYSCISHTTSNTMPGHVTWAATDSYVRRNSADYNQPVLKKTSLPSVEIWLDLIEGIDGTSDSNSEPSASVISQLKQYPLYKMLHNTSGATVMFNGQQLQFTARQIRKMPPWQKILYFKDLYEEAASLEEQRKKSITEVIESCVKSFEISRNSMAKTVRDEIEVMKKNSRNILTSKWKSLELKPITGEAIVSMRLNAYKMMCQRKGNYDTKPNWFLAVKQETLSICDDAEDIDRDTALNDLQQFSQFDDRTVQFVEQKLFLLVLSLPAHELCTKSMVQALCFVLKKVLHFEPAVLEEWIEYRKLPNLFSVDCK